MADTYRRSPPGSTSRTPKGSVDAPTSVSAPRCARLGSRSRPSPSSTSTCASLWPRAGAT